MSNIKIRIKELNKQLKIWAEEYYTNDAPSVSDLVYDAAYSELVELELANPELIEESSITQKVGGVVDNRFKKVKHELPMLSLGNAFNSDDLYKFDKQIKDQLGSYEDIEYVVEYKIDGLSISVTYEDGKLIKALTRGDGEVGEDVTHNAVTVSDIPKTIDYKKKLEVRGEVYMSDKVFERLNNEGNNFANPRNAAAGTLRQLDSKVAEARTLNAFIYSIPNPLDHNLTKHSDALAFISKQGIKTNDGFIVAKNVDAVVEAIDKITNLRDGLGYEIDGIVIKVNNISNWADIGFTAKYPKFMIAYKFPEEVATTELLDIFSTIGRTGRVTYNAKLQSVRLAGTTVQAATLHNADYIREKQIAVGDIVKVKKAGEIIPKVLGVATKKATEEWKEETNCSSCGSTLIRYEGEVDQYCINDTCPQQLIAKLEHFVSRGAMDIEGLSIETIKTFIENGLIKDIPSIFRLVDMKDEMLELPGFKEKSVNNIIKAVEESKKQDIDKFIFGLGIRHIGAKNAKILARRLGSLEAIVNVTEQDILSIRDLGVKAADSIVKFFNDESNKNMLNELKEIGLNLKELDSPTSQSLVGNTFVITGTLSKGRNYFKDIIESNNGNVSSSVTSKTSYLLAGEKAGSKLEKANKLGVKVINEEELELLIKGEYNG